MPLMQIGVRGALEVHKLDSEIVLKVYTAAAAAWGCIRGEILGDKVPLALWMH